MNQISKRPMKITCTGCWETYPAYFFPERKASPTGGGGVCKACISDNTDENIDAGRMGDKRYQDCRFKPSGVVENYMGTGRIA